MTGMGLLTLRSEGIVFEGERAVPDTPGLPPMLVAADEELEDVAPLEGQGRVTAGLAGVSTAGVVELKGS